MKITPKFGHPMLCQLGVVLLSQVLLFASSCDSRQPVGFALHELETEIRYCGEYKNFRKLPTPKALAVAGNPCGVFVSGLAYENDVDRHGDSRPQTREPWNAVTIAASIAVWPSRAYCM